MVRKQRQEERRQRRRDEQTEQQHEQELEEVRAEMEKEVQSWEQQVRGLRGLGGNEMVLRLTSLEEELRDEKKEASRCMVLPSPPTIHCPLNIASIHT